MEFFFYCIRGGLSPWAVLFSLVLVLYPLTGLGEGKSELPVGKFSSAEAGEGIPENWESLTFEKIPVPTEYSLVEEDGRTVVRAESRGGASGWIRKVNIDLKEFPFIRWRWKVMNVIESSDVTRKAGDDYAARIYVTFEYDPEKVGFLKKARYRVGRLLFGDIPIAAINYIWESKAPKGAIVDNAYTDFAKMIVIESGKEKVGRWVEERRNVYEDYQNAFEEEPPRVNGVAIMTDTDNTGESAVAFYGDIVFKTDF